MNNNIDDNEEEDDVEQCVDSQGQLLANGDTVSVIKELKVGGTKSTIKKGTVIKNIRLTHNTDEIECRYDDMKGIILRTEFLRKKA